MGLGDFDAVLGGGFVRGSIALLAGAPGIGKSTLLLQAGAAVAAAGAEVLYASGEESAEQVRGRARRLGAEEAEVLFLPETAVERIADVAARVRPRLLCVDSIQTAVSAGTDAAAGSVTQVRECAGVLQRLAKQTGIPTVLVGHVTKGGGIAGPRTLEHIVDLVLVFEGARGEDARILRAVKNRFGRVGEIAVYRMGGEGLVPVPDPALALLGERVAGPGSALTIAMEGARPLPLEVQALTARSAQAMPRRMTTGFSSRRLSMLLAVLERRGGLPLDRSEVFVNVVGGLRLADPAADAGVLAALASAEMDRVLPRTAAFLGEAGLSGELRGVGAREARLRELARAGVRDVALPSASGPSTAGDAGPEQGLRLHPLRSVGELVSWVRARGESASPLVDP